MAGSAQTKSEHINRFESRFASEEPVQDADFETVEAALELKHTAQTVEPVANTLRKLKFAVSPADKIGMSVFGKKPLQKVRDDSVAFYGFSAALVLFSFWISGGHSLFSQTDYSVDPVVTASIQSAVSSTEFKDAAWRVVTLNGKTALHVEGIVRNSGSSAVHAKPVMVTVKQNNGSTRRYLLGQNGWTLRPGQEVVVSGRLDIASASIASVDIALTQ